MLLVTVTQMIMVAKLILHIFEQKPCLRSNYIESNIEEDIDLKNQFRIKSLPDPVSIRDAVSQNYVDNKFNDPSIKKNTEHIDLMIWTIET